MPRTPAFKARTESTSPKTFAHNTTWDSGTTSRSSATNCSAPRRPPPWSSRTTRGRLAATSGRASVVDAATPTRFRSEQRFRIPRSPSIMMGRDSQAKTV
jgi:hypothetical protein